MKSWIIYTSLLIPIFGYVLCDRPNPLKNPHICGRPYCEKSNNKFIYNTDIKYKYDYEMYVSSQFSGSGDNKSEVYVTGTAIITFPTKCEGILQIEDVEISESELQVLPEDDFTYGRDDTEYVEPDEVEIKLHPKHREFAADLQRHYLRFSFHDGYISEICPSADEENWVLNLKKGVLSALQNTMQRFDIDYNTTETDVSGQCDIVYSLKRMSGTSIVIQKSKDISSCINRYKTNSVLQTTPYDFRKNFATMPILESESYCNLTIDHNVYQEITCFEEHKLVPFSNSRSGAITVTKLKLYLSDEEQFESSSYDEEALIRIRVPLLFNHYPSPKPTHGEIKNSRDLLKLMCKLGFPDIQRDFIDVFTKFVQTARLLSNSALEQLLSRAGGICSNGQNHVLESLPYIGSTASVELMVDQIVKKRVNSVITQKWLSILSLTPRPDNDMLHSFYNLIEHGYLNSEPEYILSSSAVVHTYCRNHGNCGGNKNVQRIVQFLEHSVHKLLLGNIDQRSVRINLVVLLKSLGNIGIISKSFHSKLRSIITNETLCMEVRLQAIFSHRRLDCWSVRDYFLKMYGNIAINPEIRIASYLQTMRCPDYISIKNIKTILKDEEINQVGSFVWSHLRNLAKSSSPDRVEAQGLLVDEDLGEKYNLDIRKFSRNFDYSLFFEEYNFGANVDANLIFGIESYMPRFLFFNFTVDLFGEAVNIFEISTRMQGFENIIESKFGPEGLYGARGFQEKFGYIYKNFLNLFDTDDFDYAEKLNLRLKRQPKGEVFDDNDGQPHKSLNSSGVRGIQTAQNELSSYVKNLKYGLKYKFNEPRASYAVKMFGNDLQYGTIEGDNEINSTMYKLNPMKQLRDLFSGKEINYTKSAIFLDISYVVPLCSGLPLSIHAFGASSIDLRMSGSLNVPTDLWPLGKMDFEGMLKPSVSIDIVGTMQADYYYGEAGIRVKSNFFSSSSIESKLKVRGTELASLQFSLPQDRNEIFSAKSELLVIKHDGEVPQKGIKNRYSNSSCTWSIIDKAVGLKICSEYSLPDVSNTTAQFPSLLLSGPINLDVHLDKTDLTAKTFLFEYSWHQYENRSKGSFVFETPGTLIQRVFSANVTKDPDTYNMSMSFKNGDRSHSAVGTYKNTPDDKKLEIYLNLDGKRNLALEVSMNRTIIKYGWIYTPRFLITINDDKIAGLGGTVKLMDKKNIQQYTLALQFETKKLQAQLAGHVLVTEISVSTNLKITYMFLNNKWETVYIDSELADRTLKSEYNYNGGLKLKSSAYPQFNFISNFTFISLLGHIDCIVQINNSPDLTDPKYTLKTQLTFAHFNTDEGLLGSGSRTIASIALSRPRTNTDLKFLIKHEETMKTGPAHNILVLLKFAPRKEASVVLSVHLPHGVLLSIDAAINVTVPMFDSCAAAFKMVERQPREYNLDFRGTWFSGHSIIIRGFYNDKSTIIKVFHRLKLVITSPHFDDTHIESVYWRDDSDFKINLMIDYAQQPYSLLLRHAILNSHEKLSSAEVKFQDKVYAVSANLMSREPKQLLVEVHIDKIRDIHLILRGQSTDYKKEAGIEIKWDANRDPTQKLALSIELNFPRYRVYDGNFILAYPERTFSGTFDLYALGPKYMGTASIGWSSYESIDVIFEAGSSNGVSKAVWLLLKVDTPFEGWVHNVINGGVYYHKNLLLANASALWAENQRIGIALMGNYILHEIDFTCEAKLEINSTVKDVPTLYSYFKHSFHNRKFETDINVRHTPLGETPNVFSVKSAWYIMINEHYKNVTGTVSLLSPFDGYRTGSFSTRFSLSDKRQIRGAADLDIEVKKFTLVLQGHIKKLTENMLQANITTPIERFRNIIGRFGIDENKKHIVAEIRAPHGALGVEILFSIIHITNFHVKFNLETPTEAFEKCTLVAKMKPDTIDFRGGWNKIAIGFVGVWRLVNITDFEYSYIVYTPFENLEKSGIVTKFINREEFDMELSFTFRKYNLGITMYGKPKPKLVRQLGLQRYMEFVNLIHGNEVELFQNSVCGDIESEDDSESISDYDYDLFSFMGDMELNTHIWPTIRGTIDIDETEDEYHGYGILKLPQGIVEIRDRFYFPDYMNVKNILKIKTPFINVQEIHNTYEHCINVGVEYNMGVKFAYKNHTKLIPTGISIFYKNRTLDDGDQRTHNLTISIQTPLEAIPEIIFMGSIEIEESIYKGYMSTKTRETFLSFIGSLETDENYLETSVGLRLLTPLVPNYVCNAHFKSDLEDTGNTILFEFDFADNETFNEFHVANVWQTKPNYFRLDSTINTNLLPIKKATTHVMFEKWDTMANLTTSIKCSYIDNLSKFSEFSATLLRRKEHVRVELISPIEEFGNVSFQGSLSPKEESGLYGLMGNMYRNHEIYNVDGTVQLYSHFPMDVYLKMKPMARDSIGYLSYKLKTGEGDNGMKIIFSIVEEDKFIEINGYMAIINKLNWEYALKINTSHGILSNYMNNNVDINSSIKQYNDGRIFGIFEALTPWKHLGIEKMNVRVSLDLKPISGEIHADYELSSINGSSSCEWSWIIFENMQLSLSSIARRKGASPKFLKTGLRYLNPYHNLNRLSIGVDVNVDSIWKLESNGTIMFLSATDFGAILSILMPEPIGDIYRIECKYNGDAISNFTYIVKYETHKSKLLYSSLGQYRNVSDLQGIFRVEWGHDPRKDVIDCNMQMLRKGSCRQLVARLSTPYFLDQDTITATGLYDYENMYHRFSGTLNYPARIQIADGNLTYSSLSNMYGNLNCTTPFKNLTWVRADIDFATNNTQAIRYIKAMWPKNAAFFDMNSKYELTQSNYDVQGTIKMEFPLKTRHYSQIIYSLKNRDAITIGHCLVEYNNSKVLDGFYNCTTTVGANYQRDVVNIKLENYHFVNITPIGVTYIHLFGDNKSFLYDMKRTEVYKLRDSKTYNITGELHTRSTPSGNEYKIVAIHPNRTVVLTSEYDFKNQVTKQQSKLTLSKDVWLAYNLRVDNLTKLGNESQSFVVQISYPRRNLTSKGWYFVTEDNFYSDISLNWQKNKPASKTDYDYDNDDDELKMRSMRFAFIWRNEILHGDDKDNQTAILLIKHPSFVRDVTFKGNYYRNPRELLQTSLSVQYSDELEHFLTLSAAITDLTDVVGYKNYSLNILSNHDASELNLKAEGSIGARPTLYEALGTSKYKRGYLPLQEGFLIAMINLKSKNIHYWRATPYKTVRLWSHADGGYPVYTLNATMEDSPDINTTVRFYLNIDEKYIRLETNLTPDASQNLQLLGEIPDARSASLDLWRDYEDIHVVDISYYLRMNHSRLVTSKLLWRPKMKEEIKAKLWNSAINFYESISENIDFWIKILYTESVDTINDIWDKAKPYTQEFLDDVGGLQILENDFEELCTFLNQSYEDNDFYIKTAFNFTMTVIDELAIRNHLDSVPKIILEVWQVLGDSGLALRRSIHWLIDTIKTSYRKAIEIIGRILHGESMTHISEMMETAVAKYDQFIRDLHKNTIKYVKQVWDKIVDTVTNYWKRFLQRIEPSIIKFLHYVETVVWNISKEMFDFLYKRTNELAESPYFNKVSNFTQDLDHLYRDLMANDAITNFKKYSVLAFQFLKEKYFKVVPFGKEMNQVIMEIIEEMKTLQELEPIQVAIQKFKEIQAKLDWIADQLQLEKRLHQIWAMLKNKITRFAQTALQSDDKYREAKTKFIFDPDSGRIELEQKLPMSWHSFNETPKLEEIPEYKMLIDIQELFNSHNYSLWNYYYDFKSFMDPNIWLPPFKSNSMLIGSRHFMTFDKRFVSMDIKYRILDGSQKPNECTYLLAHDFVGNNFTLVLEPSITTHHNDLISTRKLVLVTENKVIDIDIVGSALRISRGLATALPVQIGDAVIYRDGDELIVDSSKGIYLSCNLQFDICWFKLSGWYFGKTAGILGTMNNEQYDDYTTSLNHVTTNVSHEFINSWTLNSCQTNEPFAARNASLEVINLCETFFKSRMSYFVNCYALVDPQPFYEMCLDLATNSFSNIINDKHPATKGACAAALAYIQSCSEEKTPLRIPDVCIHCDLINGSYVPEGTFTKLEKSDVPQSTDIIFIIEAKPCNRNLTFSKNIMSVVSSIEKELLSANLTSNRYAVVTFGGPAPFDKPRSVVYDNQIFSDAIKIKHYFNHIQTAESNYSDIFEAISMASKLISRPGASKTFILLPCSSCNSTFMKLDYSSVLQILLDEGIKLHILMNTDFDLNKKRIERLLFGIDREYAYTKKYLTDNKGDSDIRNQIILPKNILGNCLSLAIQSNGTVFAGHKLRPEKRNPVKKFSAVFGKRIALTAKPNNCQICECTGHNTGFAYMTCTHCGIPSAPFLDYGFDEDDMLSILQMGTDQDWDWEDISEPRSDS